MAGTSVLKLKVDDKEYNASLKQAQQGMQHLEQALKDAGKSFTQVDKSVVDYVRSIGQMEAQSKTARGRISEMSNAFVELSLQYKQMSDEVKNSDVGKALAASMEQLKQRTIDAKDELDELNKSLNNVKMPEGKGGGLFSGLGDKMSGAMQVFAGNMLTKAAGAVANLGSEMMETAKQSVELARQGEGVRIAFERLNNPGLLANLKEATHGTVSELELMKAAVKFDDFKLPVEQLGTLLAFAQKKASDTGQSVDYMVDSIVTGLGRKSLMILDNLGLSASQVKERMAETGDMTKAVADIIREEMEKSGGYVETAADRAARATAQAQDKMMELGRSAMPVAEAFDEAWGEIRLGAMELMTTVLVPIANFLKQLREESNRTAEDIVTKGMTDVTDTVDDNGRLIRKNAINSIPEITVSGTAPKTTRRSGGGGGSKGFDISSIAFDPNKAMLAAMKAPEPEGGSEAWNTMREAIAGCKEEMADYSAETANWSKNYDAYRENMDKMTKAAKQQEMAFSMAGQSAENLGAALAGMDDPAARAAGTVISAIANIALGFGQAVASAGSMGPWAWLAYVAAGTAALATTISTVHSLTGYAEGGIIKGNSYSGDNIGGLVDGSQLVGLNAGEVVLTAAMTNNLASSLQNGGGTVNVVGRIRGTDIILSVDRTLSLEGKQLLTWGR